MKNLSLKKLLGLFGGFLAVVLLIAVIIVRAGREGGAQPRATKVYHHELTAAPTPDPLPPTVAATGYRSGPTSLTAAPADARSVLTDELTRAATGNTPPPALVASCAPAVDLMPRLGALDGRLEGLAARVGVLEASAAVTAALQREREAVAVRSPTAARPVRAKALTTLPGYKAMAVVGERAWVRMPDGTEDSATTGEALARPRVRSVSHDTGIIITSTDERIDPQ
ncbi:MAG: Type secretion protein DotF [Gammaproteobacteria bacterium]|nr:Type secretion protein DotF [Gammaproteobacteria bacterium]